MTSRSPLRRSIERSLAVGALALLLAPSFILAQRAPTVQPVAARATAAAPALKPLNLEDYGRFNRINAAALSSDGKWMTYTYSPNDGQGTLYIKNLDANTLYTIPRGSAAQISDNSRWAAYFIDPATGGRGGGGRGGAPGGGRGRGATPPQQAATDAAPQAAARVFEVLDLQTGAKTEFPAVASFGFSPDGSWLLIRPQTAGAAPAPDAAAGRGGRGGRGGAPPGPAGPGTDLIMRNLATGNQRYIGNVSQYSFDDDGKQLAYTVSGTERLGNGVYLLDVESGATSMLDAAVADYDELTWSTDGNNLAVLRGNKARDKAQRDNAILAWTNVGTPQAKAATFDPTKAGGFPKDEVVSEFAALRWSEDGKRIWLGLKEQTPEWMPPPGPQANVDVWHWNDPQPQSVQIVQVNQERRSTFSAVYDLASNTVRQVGDSSMRQITPSKDMLWGVGGDTKPYRGEIAWGGSHADYYKVNLTSGERTLIAKGLERTLGFSPDDKYWVYQENGHVFSYEMATGKKTQIDGGKSFIDAEDDHDYEKPTYGVAGFTSDNKQILLNDRYDVWAAPLAGGTLTNVTKGEGAKQEVRFRIERIGAAGGGGRGGRGGGRGGGAAAEGVDLSKPVTLSAYGQWTKKSGYFTLPPNGAPTPMIWEDKSISSPTAAKNGDRIIFTEQTFTEFPDYWVSNKTFASPKKVTDANPFISEYAWGTKAKLIDYKDRFGHHLQATLTLPAGYEPGKKYPMLVYFYELMSDQHHRFSMPVYDDRPHMSTYASNGYLVLQPDVVYEIGKPGTSAVDCVTSAVKKVIELGYADPKHIGLQGHSWGGYQSSYILTQTNIFAAVVTGAPPTDLISFVGSTYGSSGTLQQGITEVGQVRMGKDRTPFNSKDLYEQQSAVFNVTKITTPFMILQGTADNAVDWHQGLEYYAIARRAGKEVIFLSYPDEPHHLGVQANQKDFQVRMRQFFDHYLKDAPAPKWMTDGVPQTLKGRENLPIPQARSATNNNGNGPGGDINH